MILGEISLLTRDVPRLAAFYRKVLGIPGENANAVHQFILTEGTGLSIYNDGKTQTTGAALAFTVDDVDAEYARLMELGVEIAEMPQTRPWGARNMRFDDPDGNQIYFRSLL